MNIRDYFIDQLATAKPSPGNFQMGRSYEEAVEAIQRCHEPPIQWHEAKARLDERNAEFKLHEGERQLYYMLEVPSDDITKISIEVLRIWESELDTLKDYEYVFTTNPRAGGTPIPKFRKPPTPQVEKKYMCVLCQDEGLVEGLDFYGCSPTYETCQCK